MRQEHVAQGHALLLVPRDVPEVIPANAERERQALRGFPFVLDEEAPRVEEVLVSAGPLPARQRVDPRPALSERLVRHEVDQVVESERDSAVGVIETGVVVAPPAADSQLQGMVALEHRDDVPPVEVVLNEHGRSPCRTDSQALALDADARNVDGNGPSVGRLVEPAPCR